ncbi:MAG: tRNA (adenosine(37)-N6)-dimethylallyltransferase MiaA [Bacteroidetes bacterium]|nr:MAG: tRNA (adenosine(37)-N6)-dimethylallyltransferase MiaA [Bacteroidota bacterium]
MKESPKTKTLVVITGPTAVGKTETSLTIAGELQAEIISADARQFYHELKIGTAAPTPAELQRVKHHFAGHLSIFDYYNVSRFEQEALARAEELFRHSDYVVVTGGSGLYIDALCKGIDDLPDIDPHIRNEVQQLLKKQGMEGLRSHLKSIDPEYYNEVDKANPNRMMRGIEIYLATGKKFSQLRKKQTAQRPFHIKKVILNRPRHELFQRINHRTDVMVKDGIVEEAIRFFKYRHLNALNTVGYKELFAWLENRMELHAAIEKIRIHTRRYAKRQLTWFKRYEDAQWFLPSETHNILRYVKNQ